MTYFLTHYISLLRSFPDLTEAPRSFYIDQPHQHFVCTNPLTFRRPVAFILLLVRKSTAAGLHDFFGFLGQAPLTKFPFAQRRRAIRPSSGTFLLLRRGLLRQLSTRPPLAILPAFCRGRHRPDPALRRLGWSRKILITLYQ